MIKVVNYRVGNLQNLLNGIAQAGFKAELAHKPEELAGADKIILPGVGAFGHAMDNLKKLGFHEALLQVASHVKILGVCVGMQLLFTKSFEHGEHEGLGLIPGTVQLIRDAQKVPHMGWNQVAQKGAPKLFQDIPDPSWFYFVHSFICRPEDPQVIAGVTSYGNEFASAVAHGNVFGAQFHPEKSHDAGIRLLANFCSL